MSVVHHIRFPRSCSREESPYTRSNDTVTKLGSFSPSSRPCELAATASLGMAAVKRWSSYSLLQPEINYTMQFDFCVQKTLRQWTFIPSCVKSTSHMGHSPMWLLSLPWIETPGWEPEQNRSRAERRDFKLPTFAAQQESSTTQALRTEYIACKIHCCQRQLRRNFEESLSFPEMC